MMKKTYVCCIRRGCRGLLWALGMTMLSLVGCQPSSKGVEGCRVADVKERMGSLCTLDLAKGIASVSYVPLQTPSDLSLYTREGKVSVPKDMPMEEDGNPVLVFHKLKE